MDNNIFINRSNQHSKNMLEHNQPTAYYLLSKVRILGEDIIQK